MNKLLAKLRGLNEVEQMLYDMKLAFKREGSKTVVLGDVFLSGKHLKKLPDFSEVEVRGNFYCDNNNLTSLYGAPHTVKGAFHCHDNKLETLEDAPRKFRSLKSDFGVFSKASGIPLGLQGDHQARDSAFTKAATVLEEKIKIKKPLSFRIKPAG